mgnify:FL=1|tara:strand:+ start:832 stop:1608 length:777 start_codon:yes stop_codon:yes gene_type:complete
MDFGINIDKVYQKVLAIANKEQRGYITPQEFNLFADQAQMNIFEQYFFDINQFNRVPGNQTDFSDPLSGLEEKISFFKKRQEPLTLANDFGDVFLNDYIFDMFKLGTVYRRYKNGSLKTVDPISSFEEYRQITSSKLLAPTELYPKYIRYYAESSLDTTKDRIKISPYSGLKDLETQTGKKQVFADYIRKPAKPNWSYVVVNEQALYDSTTSDDFELHKSEENNLIFKILQLAGITIDINLYQVAAQEEIKNIQQEKA